MDSFSASYAYDAIHNMTRNTQVHVVKTLGAPGEGIGHPTETNHDFAYEYSPSRPHQATRIGDTFAVYDASGNVDRECAGAPGCGAGANHLRQFYWTEENRIAAVIDGNGENVTRFVYDAAGERVAKLGRGGESLSIGQFFSLKGRRAASKHVFAGATRIATKVSSPPGWQPADPAVLATQPGEPPSGSSTPGCLPSDYQPSKCGAYPGGSPVVLGPPDTRIRPETYYYHSDHLGSTGWVTDQDARVHEHVEYFPYGQIWRDVRADADAGGSPDQRFLFTGKELDEETGLYYFGARYYDPRHARWLSTDPFPELLGRIRTAPERTFELSLYSYAAHRPTTLTDPDGKAVPIVLAICAAGACEAAAKAAIVTVGIIIGVGALDVVAHAPRPTAPQDLPDISQEMPSLPGQPVAPDVAPPPPQAPVDPSSLAIPASVATATATATVTQASEGSYRPPGPLPRDPRTGKPVPDSPYPHTQVGTKVSKKTGKPYTKAREFGESGQHIRGVDFTDHGRGDHSNPHQHKIDPKTGKRGPPTP